MHESIKTVRYMYIFLLTVFLSLSVPYLVCYIMVLSKPKITYCILTLLFVGLLSVIDYLFRGKRIIFLIVGILLFCAVLYYFKGSEIIQEVIAFANEFERYVYGSYRASETFVKQIHNCLLFGGTLLIFILNKWFPTRVILGYVSIFALILLCIFNFTNIPFISLFLMLVYILVIFAEMIQFFSFLKRDYSVRIYLVSKFIPVIIVLVLIITIIPASSKPLDLLNIREKLAGNNAPHFLTDILDFFNIDHDFESKFENIGGDYDTSNDDTELAQISGLEKYNQPQRIYFTKKVCDTYKNSQWENSIDGYESGVDSYILDTTQFYLKSLAIQYDNSIYIKPYIEAKQIYIEYKNINNGYIIYPSNTYNFSGFEGDFDTSTPTIKNQENNEIDSYYVRYLMPFDYSSYVDTFMSARKVDDRINIYSKAQEGLGFYYKKRPNLRAEEIVRLSKEQEPFIAEKYTQLSSDVTQRVKELAAFITSNCKTDYQKVKALEQYLKTNYTYTLTPGKVPLGNDVVDYFLFENKNGYCTYFATSMAVMARSLGIPARYVSGYVVNTDEVVNNQYTITGKDSHAWVEVYFPDAGWIRFEPTASSHIGGNNSTSVTSSSNDSSEVDSKIDSSEDASSINEDSSSISDSLLESSQQESSLDSDDNSSEILQDDYQNMQYNNLSDDEIRIIIVVLLLIIALLCYVRMMSIYYRFHKKYNKMNNRRKVCADFEIIMMILHKRKMIRQDAQTLKEVFGDKDIIINNKTYSLNKAVNIYMKAYYGECEITDSDYTSVYALRKLLENNIVKHKLFGLNLFYRLHYYKKYVRNNSQSE